MRKTSLALHLISIILLIPFYGLAQRVEDVRISLQLKDVPLKEVIRHIENLTPFKFVAKAEDIEKEFHFSIDVIDQPLSKVFEKIFEGRNLEYKQIDKNILIKRSSRKINAIMPVNSGTAVSQKYSLYGTIKSAKTGETLIGSTITVEGISAGTISNEYGFYSLTLSEGSYAIVVSAIGMQIKEQQVVLNKNILLDVLLDEKAKDLEAVTVTASARGRSLKKSSDEC